ncbi:MAG TPA: hypothetical protein VMI75_18110 [Polyangiaceae bacterium]|nr:hypothetical protein [Polyangiaceae bacterium]
MKRGHVAIVGLFAAACSGVANPGPPEPPAHPGDWTCVGKGTTARLEPVQPRGRFAVALQDASTHAPVGDLLLAVCALEDEDCATPASQEKADHTGSATLTVPVGRSPFDGFVRVSGASIATHYVFLPEREAACPSCALVLPIYTSSALATLTKMTGLKLDAKEGLVRVDLQDCAGAPAKDVSVSIGGFNCSESGAMDAGARAGVLFRPEGCRKPLVAYATGGNGSVTRAALASDATGVALGFGVAPGRLGIAALLDGKTIAGAIGFTRGGAVSEFVLRPRFSPAPPLFSQP